MASVSIEHGTVEGGVTAVGGLAIGSRRPVLVAEGEGEALGMLQIVVSWLQGEGVSRTGRLGQLI